MTPTPSLLRLARIGRSAVPSWPLLVLVAACAAALTYGGLSVWRLRKPPTRPAPVNPALPSTGPVAAHAGSREVARPIAASAAPPGGVKHPRERRQHRIESPTMVPRPVGTRSRALPHKMTPAASPAGNPKAAAPPPAPAAPLETAPAETRVPEDDEKSRAEAAVESEGIRFVVKAHLPQVHACYERAFKDSSPGGRVEIALVIGADGRATQVRTELNTTDSELLARCLEGRMREWRFPRPVGGEYEIIYPFVFAPSS